MGNSGKIPYYRILAEFSLGNSGKIPYYRILAEFSLVNYVG
jgi:hypothetical protein